MSEAIDVANLESKFREVSKAIVSSGDLESLRRDWLGREGTLKVLFKQLKDIPAEEKPKLAARLNALKGTVETFIQEKSQELTDSDQKAKLNSEYMDLSLPALVSGLGNVHPIRLVERRIHQLLKPFGVRIVEGPEIETEYYCFDALNIPKHHPARDMQDTFYTDTDLGQGPLHVLRTHTTSVQARELQKGELPLKIVSCGRVYRNETEDASHQAMFHQYELVWIDKGLTLANLMGILSYILKGLYGKKRKVRFVQKYYPYTEPSLGAQIDCSICKGVGCAACAGAGWVTILGSGMVHRNVFTEFGYDPDRVSGMAFGLGTARLAAQMYQSPNLKTLYDGDLRVLRSLQE